MVDHKTSGSSDELENLTDSEIVERLKESRDRKLQGILYDRYIDRVFFKCLSITNDTSMARDFAHDIFIKIFLNLGKFRGDSSLSLWIHSITYNHCIRELKKSGKIIYQDGLEAEETISNEVEKKYEWESQKIREETLKLAMNRLEPQDRILLLLKYQEHQRIEDIAGQMDLSVSAVKMRLMRVRNKLKSEIDRILNSEAP